MTALRPWSGFDSLVDGLARLQARARDAAARSVDKILTLRNWLIGAWIVAYEQEGADRARYGEGLIDALAASCKARGGGGLGRSNLKNYRQIALTWPMLGTRQTSGESGSSQAWQTLSAESVPACGHRAVRRQGCRRGALRHRKSGASGLRRAIPDPPANRTSAARLAGRRA